MYDIQGRTKNRTNRSGKTGTSERGEQAIDGHIMWRNKTKSVPNKKNRYVDDVVKRANNRRDVW